MLSKRNSLLDYFNIIDRYFGSPMWWEEPRWPYGYQTNKVDPVSFTIDEDSEKYYIRGVLPGYSEDDIKITLNGKKLSLKGEKKTVVEEKDKFSSTSNSFDHSVLLQNNADTNTIEAELKNGILVVSVHKTDSSNEEKVIPLKTKE